jgi:heterodisulfide reductase subunit C
MDMGPRQIMHAIQLGLKENVLESSTIWLCISCQTCSARCPNEIDIARVMESLRWLAAAEKSEPAEKGIELFHRLFLIIIQRFGRIHELSLGVLFNMLGRHPFAKVTTLPGMFARGKVTILPPRVKGAAEIRGLYARVRAMEEESYKREAE